MDRLVKKLKKSYGDGAVYHADQSPPLEVLSTGSVAVDFATGVGGLPRGCLVEIFGAESMGKTTLSYYMIANEQRKGNNCAFINLEGQFSPQWAQRVAGVDTSKLLVVQPAHGDEAAELLADIVNDVDPQTGRGTVSLVVFDSIGAMLSAKEAAPDGTDRVGGQSKLVTGMVKRCLTPCWQNRVTIVFLNQIRDVMNAMYGGMVESPGGHALKHGAALRIQLKPGKDKYKAKVNGQDKEIGQRIVAVIKKNKAGSPKATAAFDFIWDEVEGKKLGIDHTQEVKDLCFQYGIIEQNGAYYSHPLFPQDDKGLTRIYTRDAVEEFLTANEEVLSKLRDELMELARTNGGSSDG